MMRALTSASAPPAIAAGDIEFFEKIVPPLLAGDYEITLAQELDYGSAKQSFHATQAFSVQAPRFSLPSEDVQAVFPADGAAGKFETFLPQIVLNKRALPWEHRLARDDDSGVPWLALLVLSGPEIVVPPTSLHGASETFAASFRLGDIRNVDAGGVLGPVIAELDYGQSDDDICRTIDLPTATFLAVVPHLDATTPANSELATLAHVREVNMEHKEILDMTHSGWFSVIVANRFPVDPEVPTRQYVHLVSLEGFKPYLTEGATFPAGTDVVRLISLFSWSFTSLPDHGESFSSFMLHLVADDSEAHTDLLFRLPLDPALAAKDPSPGQIASKALESGYVPLRYSTRYGQTTMAWYRGPLSPVKPDAFPRTSAIPHFTAASDAVIFDTDTGLFDLSYSAAWQTGRLMALADRGFGTALMDWRKKTSLIIDLLANQAEQDKLDHFLETYDGDIDQWFHDQLITQSFIDYLLGQFAQQVAPHVNSNSANLGGVAATAKDPPKQLVEELKRLMANPDVTQLMADIKGPEYQTIVGWLARTALLYNMPFERLVPNPDLLPIETIRFFYVDRSWIDSLIDGAMSVGVQSSRDSNYYRITKGQIRDAVDDLILQLREQLLGLPPTPQDPTDGVIAGFVMRSAVFAQYPGIEVKAYRTITKNAEGDDIGTDPMKLLRMDRLSPNVMLCLFPDAPARVEFDEPKEGLVFGVEPVEAMLEIAIRDPANGEVIPDTVYTLDDQADFRGDRSGRVLNVGHLNQALAGKLSLATLNAAQFALQMVKVPEQMVFQNKQ